MAKLKAWIVPAVMLLIGGTYAATASAQTAAERCKAFSGDRFAGGYTYSRTPDAPTYIVFSGITEAADDIPEFCEIRGYSAAQVTFAVRLPTTTWNKKLLMTGCGEGYCG